MLRSIPAIILLLVLSTNVSIAAPPSDPFRLGKVNSAIRDPVNTEKSSNADRGLEEFLSGFAVLAILTILSIYVWECLLAKTRSPLRSLRALWQNCGPLMLRVPSAILGALAVLELAQSTPTTTPEAYSPCVSDPPISMNPDIGGLGTRVGLYISDSMAVAHALLGHFHTETSGTKQLCSAQVLSEQGAYVTYD